MIKLLLANLALTPLVALTYKSHSACSPGTPEIIADILQPLGRHTNGAETTQHEQDITSLFAKLKVNYAGLNQLAQPVLWDTPFDLSFVSDELLPLSVIPIQLPWFEFETPIRLITTRGLPCVIVGNNDLGSLGYKLTRELPGHLITTQAGEDDLPLASPHIVQDHINMESFIKKKKNCPLIEIYSHVTGLCDHHQTLYQCCYHNNNNYYVGGCVSFSTNIMVHHSISLTISLPSPL